MDFASFYDKQPDYVSFRNDPSRRRDYEILSDWKVRKLVQLVPEGLRFDNVLEVGCAFGVLLNNIAGRLGIKDRTGVDISAKNIEVARDLFPECTFFAGTLEEFISKQPDGPGKKRFDLVVLSDIIEHLPDDLGFLKTVQNYCSFVLLNLPLEKSLSTRNRNYGEEDPSGHLRCYDNDDAVRLVTEAGYTIVKDYTSTAFFDEQFYGVYKKNRDARIGKKTLPKKAFWTLFYFLQDKLKSVSRGLTDKIYGTNYFALLKSQSP
ncbi:MAG TPA: methyltransferase domain-containing protein [Bacteroidales bacterium]|nr:methyltransferase domain-containing protein [Bacteroidales bacterium]